MKILLSICLLILSLSACNANEITGKACLGKNNGSLVEGLKNVCKKGDAIATKNPAYFCDFNYSIAFNQYDSAMCIYSGTQKEERALSN